MQSHVSVRAGASQRSQEERGHGHRGGVPGRQGWRRRWQGCPVGEGASCRDAALPTPRSGASGLRNCKRIHFSRSEPPTSCKVLAAAWSDAWDVLQKLELFLPVHLMPAPMCQLFYCTRYHEKSQGHRGGKDGRVLREEDRLKKWKEMQECFKGQQKILWRRKWQPTPVFLPGKCHGQRNLVGYHPWRCKESDTTERLRTKDTGR
ncbi:uncharacterized protein LOC129624480 isoform X2 [Bubalus kerabau]|uniref:uncharacterized protein LOC129624480 isoform X2 n=1 Tax=Bubalus carabanensis TaxID=3119969 RepID=UPI00244E9DA8|nr:uncharacterized protein LOC129624480 isoform X2 [Bubalus carabanensis]